MDIFGYVAYAHIMEDKLGIRALKCVLISYPKDANGFSLYLIEEGINKIIINRDVAFNENHFPLLRFL